MLSSDLNNIEASNPLLLQTTTHSRLWFTPLVSVHDALLLERVFGSCE